MCVASYRTFSSTVVHVSIVMKYWKHLLLHRNHSFPLPLEKCHQYGKYITRNGHLSVEIYSFRNSVKPCLIPLILNSGCSDEFISLHIINKVISISIYLSIYIKVNYSNNVQDFIVSALTLLLWSKSLKRQVNRGVSVMMRGRFSGVETER